MPSTPSPSSPPRPWSVVLAFGLVSLFADMVYEGARSLYGPALLALGASAAVVGLVAGLGEAMALVLRIVAGPVADRRGAHWGFTIGGYALTAVCVPLLAVSPLLGAAGLGFGTLLILAERTGKAVRSPSKSALLAHAARAVGRGKGFGVHKALDQIGAFAGPLSVAAVLALGGSMWTGLAWLAVPGVLALGILVVLRARVPDLAVYDRSDAARPADRTADAPGSPTSGRDDAAGPVPSRAEPVSPAAAGQGRAAAWWRDAAGSDLPRAFFGYAIAASLTTGGLITFALIAVHLSRGLALTTGAIPLVYAAAMLVEAVAALTTGWAYDRWGTRVLLVVPLLVAAVPWLIFQPVLPLALAGVAAWAAASGVQDSTIKALVADLVPAQRLATAYGIFAAIQGLFAIVGGAAAGWLLDHSPLGLVIGVGCSQLIAVALLIGILRGRRR